MTSATVANLDLVLLKAGTSCFSQSDLHIKSRGRLESVRGAHVCVKAGFQIGSVNYFTFCKLGFS